MRISNNMIYGTTMQHMQTSLASFMESTIQGGTQKKINRPSDDPAGTALVLNTRTEIAATEQYERNLGTAKSWLTTTDATLQEVSATLIAIEKLAEQAATNTVSAENRTQISYELEQLFGQLINLSNVEVENNSIFGGHNYQETAFEEGMTVTSWDTDFDPNTTRVSGAADKSMAIRFTGSDLDPPTDPPTGTIGTDELKYQWTSNGGDTWNDGILAAGETTITQNGVTIDFRSGTEVKIAQDTSTDNVDSEDGTFLYLYPTAIYNGDDKDASAYANITTGDIDGLDVTVHANLTENVLFRLNNNIDLNAPGPSSFVNYGISHDGGATWVNDRISVPNPANGTVQLPFDDAFGDAAGYVELNMENAATGNGQINLPFTMDLQPRRVDMLNGPADLSLDAQGIFSQNIAVRIDNDPSVDLATPGEVVNYSYSTDKGQSWIQASSVVPNPAGSTTLTVPGGFLTLNTQNGGSTVLEAGDQMLIHPDRAELGYEVMENTYIPVNQVGKDIFGGMYNGETVEGDNIFDAVGKLIAYCEHNDTDGIGESLVSLKASHEHMLTQLAKVGGLDNRLDLAADMLSHEKLDQGERLSNTEDIDLTELLNKLAKDELTYSTVLQASSMILQLNFTKFI